MQNIPRCVEVASAMCLIFSGCDAHMQLLPSKNVRLLGHEGQHTHACGEKHWKLQTLLPTTLVLHFTETN